MKVAVAFIAIGFYTFAQTMAEGQAQAIVEGQAASACRSQMELAVEPAVAEVAVGEVVGPEADRGKSQETLSPGSQAASACRSVDGAKDNQVYAENETDADSFWAGLDGSSDNQGQAADEADEAAFWASLSDCSAECETQVSEGNDLVWVDAKAERLMRAKVLFDLAAESRKEADEYRAKLVAADASDARKAVKRQKQALLTSFFPGRGDMEATLPDPFASLRGSRGPVHPCSQTFREREIA